MISGKETIIIEEITDNMVSVTVHEIDGVELGDGGVFICIAENKLGGDEARTTLTVGCKKNTLYKIPRSHRIHFVKCQDYTKIPYS